MPINWSIGLDYALVFGLLAANSSHITERDIYDLKLKHEQDEEKLINLLKKRRRKAWKLVIICALFAFIAVQYYSRTGLPNNPCTMVDSRGCLD